MDTVYPEPIRLRLGSTPRRQRGLNRYRTQPVTFSEIQEVDEENVNEEEHEDVGRRMSAEAHIISSKSSSNVNAKYEELWSRRKADRRISKKMQNRLDLTKKPSVSSIPGSPENGNNSPSENKINFSQTNLPSNTDIST